ncbi:hypothetical protein NDU88_007477 [Pleurodeles waltl]|uniref:Uncharacterized protein n=1 Tax=Pleurodeles waltl TaxID=8319 RepID=A0AAV7RR30_PLEWA|nr:hypothetical protein NDU88_007477 [Pleurodeles waltl]
MQRQTWHNSRVQRGLKVEQPGNSSTDLLPNEGASPNQPDTIETSTGRIDRNNQDAKQVFVCLKSALHLAASTGKEKPLPDKTAASRYCVYVTPSMQWGKHQQENTVDLTTANVAQSTPWNRRLE